MEGNWLSFSLLGLCGVLLLKLAAGNPLVVSDMASARAHMIKYMINPDYTSNPEFGQLADMAEFTAGLRVYQRNMQLEVTGILDTPTMEMMNKPRCGSPDLSADRDDMKKRKRRFALQGSKWETGDALTVRITNNTPDLTMAVVNRTMKQALKFWSDVADIDFKIVTFGTADIDILFAAGEHGDGAASAFDGRGGTLAHAYFPQYGGDAHFDEDEDWTVLTSSGINLLQVAIHEFGHSLGLSHSDIQGAIMFPSYLGYQPNIALHGDDISGIQTIYGRRTTPPIRTTTTTTTTTTARTTQPGDDTTTTTTTTPTPRPGAGTPFATFCDNVGFDATTTFGGKTYVFRGNAYGVLDGAKFASGYPRFIAGNWPGLNGITKIDAALAWLEHSPPRLYLFSGSQYWRFQLNSDNEIYLLDNYPKDISTGFPGLPNDVGFAIVWSGNGRSYIFKDDVYYRLSEVNDVTRGTVDSGYPRGISVWNLAASTYESAMQWENDRTYFFTGDQYVRYDDRNLRIDRNTRVAYPRPLENWWLQCQSGGLQGTTPIEGEDEGGRKNNFQFTVVQQQSYDDDDVDTGVGSAATVSQNAILVLSSLVLALFLRW